MYDGIFIPHKKYFTTSSMPEIDFSMPTFSSSNVCIISLPGTIAGQYHHFFIMAHAKSLTFFTSIKAHSRQKSKSNTTYLPVVKFVDSIRISSPIICPSSLHLSFICCK